MVVDIGGGTTDIAVLSLGDVVAGALAARRRQRHGRGDHALRAPPASAADRRGATPSASRSRPAPPWRRPNGRAAEIHIRGRDLRQGNAKSVVLRAKDIAEALSEPVDEMAEFIQRALEDLPPEISTDIAERGIHLTGGGALLDRLDVELTRRVGVTFHVPQNPMHCVVKGSAAVLAGLPDYEHLLMRP